MRSPKSLAVVCRRPNGSIVIKEDEWRPVFKGSRLLRLPFLRGGIVVLESLVNGMSAMNWAASQQLHGAPGTGLPTRSLGARSAQEPKEKSGIARFGMVALSIFIGLALLVGASHLAAWGLGTILGFDATTLTFHVVDGVIKLAIFIGYLTAISKIDDVKRVFQYHGAEHMAIFTYEAGLALTVDNARKQTRFHPRCGTSLLLIVILVSVAVFSALLSFPLAESSTSDHLLKILLKIPLMVPIGGLSYELLKLAGKHSDTSRLALSLSTPGMWMQRITTKVPDDSQLEIALISIRKTLWREAQGAMPPKQDGKLGYEVYPNADAIDLPLVA